MELTHVLLSPVVTEKSTAGQAAAIYTFRVHPQANKIEIANAVARAYGVSVKKVNIIPIRQKTRLIGRGRTITKRPAAKKALVTLEGKQTLDPNKFTKKK